MARGELHPARAIHAIWRTLNYKMKDLLCTTLSSIKSHSLCSVVLGFTCFTKSLSFHCTEAEQVPTPMSAQSAESLLLSDVIAELTLPFAVHPVTRCDCGLEEAKISQPIVHTSC